jgi:integrase
MTVFKRGKYYAYHFEFSGQHIQKSTRQSNLKVARDMEATHRSKLAKGEVGIHDSKPVPTLREFASRFTEFVEVNNASEPNTVLFYRNRIARLLDFAPLARTRLDQIDAAGMEAYVQNRSKQVSVTSVNRELATLSRLLHIAVEFKVIVKTPKIRRLKGEAEHDFVLSYDQEKEYLSLAPQTLKDAAILLVDTGLRIGELTRLEWADIHLEPVGSAKFGYVRVRKGKSRNAKRNVSLTARVKQMLTDRLKREPTSAWVFPNKENDGLLSVGSFNHLHSKLTRPKVNGEKVFHFPAEFVLHSLRHTMLTRLGESGAGAFEIMKIAGHANIGISSRYVHPTPESQERAFERLETLNSLAGKQPVTVQTILTPVSDFLDPRSWGGKKSAASPAASVTSK